MRSFYPYTKGYRQWILLGVACSIAEAVLELELPQAMSDIVTSHARQKKIHEWVVKKIKDTYVWISPQYRGCNFQYEGWVR